MTTGQIGPDAYRITVAGADFDVAGTFGVINPATGRVFAQAPEVTPDRLDEIMATAAAAFRGWRRDEAARIAAMRAAADVIEANADYLAPILTSEQGMPLREAKADVGRAVEWMRYYVDLEIPRELVRNDMHGYAEVFRRPLGVVSAITPWNFPLALAFWKIAPALRAGNTIVVKPSAFTPLSILEISRLLRDVLPDGVFTVVTGGGKLGAALVAHPHTNKVSFTGSTEVGRLVGVAAAQNITPATLELGGNDAAIVFDDVDVQEIAQRLFWASFLNNGQACLAAKRIYVQDRIYDDVVEAVAAVARSVPVGDGKVPNNLLGPVNNKPQFDRVAELVNDAIASGAKVAAGGAPIKGEGYFYAPTVLADLTDGVRVVDEEQFGPVMPIVRFSDADDAVRRANASPYGLTASVWTPQYERALRVAAELDAGQVSINVHGLGVQTGLPFGGHKQSGIGVENGIWGYYGFTETTAVTGFQAVPDVSR
ncbi:aldehyde dehydrogenase family protein [Dactylosporangium sp. NPDC005572]|uniref:aldehyde dehydrogenase family protein n=1 Tax=Dactylosporangium sp. NPDC005572 TaxID=3156889 RepID=UPI0033BEBEBF